MRNWNLGQRLVVVVATGLVMKVLADWVLYSGAEGGWFGYAPNSVDVFSQSSGRRYGPGATSVIAMVFIASWAAISLRLLSGGRGDE